MKDLSKAAEQKALDALEGAIESVGAGMTPDAAIIKAAQDNKLTAQMTQRMIEAYNVSKTLNHLKNSEGEKRAEAFDIADPTNIFAELFPKDPETEQKKAASALHTDYMLGGVSDEFMKIAEVVELPPMVAEKPQPYEQDPATLAKRAYDERNALKLQLSQARSAARRAYFESLGHTDKAADYWREIGDREPFDLVEKRAVANFGETGYALMNLIYEKGDLGDPRLNIKRAAVEELGTQQMMFETAKPPYGNIAAAVTEARLTVQMSKRAAQLADELHTHALEHHNIFPETVVTEAIDFFMPKAAKKKDDDDEYVHDTHWTTVRGKPKKVKTFPTRLGKKIRVKKAEEEKKDKKKDGKKDMPDFLDQDRPEKVKEIYKALKREHPEYSAGKKARIANAKGASDESPVRTWLDNLLAGRSTYESAGAFVLPKD